MSSIGKSGASASGPTGWCVAGCSGGEGGLLRSAATLYQCVGGSDSGRKNFFVMDPLRAPASRPCFDLAPPAVPLENTKPLVVKDEGFSRCHLHSPASRGSHRPPRNDVR